MNTKRLSCTAAAAAAYCIVTLSPSAAFAGAWTRPESQLLFVAPFSYQVADKAFDDDGKRVRRDRFEMFEFTPLFEYGISERLTGGLQPKFRRVNVDTAGGSATNSGLAEADAYMRYRLWQRDRAAFSVQGLVKVPINPDEGHVAALGRDQIDAELRLLYGNRHELTRGGAIFYNGGLAYRKRFKGPDDQIHADAYVGWAPGGAWTFIARSANTLGIGSEGGTREVLTTAPSFRRHEAQLIANYRFTERISASMGVSTTYAGESVGAGRSGFVSLVSTF